MVRHVPLLLSLASDAAVAEVLLETGLGEAACGHGRQWSQSAPLAASRRPFYLKQHPVAQLLLEMPVGRGLSLEEERGSLPSKWENRR